MLHLNDESYSERLEKSFRYCHLEATQLINKNKKVKAAEIAFLPLLEFFKKYILKSGFLDGTPGLISAIHSAGAKFRILTITWDQQNTLDRAQLEKKYNNE